MTLCSGPEGDIAWHPGRRSNALRARPGGAGSMEVAGARLLVVDDEQRILNFVARGLRAEGYTVDVAPDGPRVSSRR